MFKKDFSKRSHEIRSIKHGSGMLCLLNTVQQEKLLKKSLEIVSEKSSKKFIISLFCLLNTCGILRCENFHYSG